ncbi:MAG TPA: helix-turn-helix domain-containing protein [Gemmatimonadales bacterium]|nr:helix-turn-helix domain-containing protein [Gemmatimonadales bacterium]
MTDYRLMQLSHADPDVLVGVIDGSEMRHRILPGGAITVRLEQSRPGTGWLQRGRYGMSVLAQGALPQGVVTIGGMLSSPADTMINGHFCPPGSLQVYAERCELHYRAAPDTTWFAYCIEREALQHAALQLLGRPLPLPTAGAVNLRLAPVLCRRIACAVEAVFAAARSPDAAEVTRADRNPLHFDLAAALMAGSSGGVSTRDRLHVAQRCQLIRRAEEYLSEHLRESFDLAALSDAVGLSHRMLEYHFRRTYGVSPLAWHRSMRLDAVRQDLRRARRRGESVTLVAMRWGFHHFGRFAAEYRRLYGERPIDTLRGG